jgi:3D (Asp-Asp-Asp) domain-containing protein
MNRLRAMLRTRPDVVRVVLAVSIAGLYWWSGTMRLPAVDHVFRHKPVVVYPEPMLRPIVVRPYMYPAGERGPYDPAKAGQAIKVSLTQYCLKGTTRRGRYVRPGIVAADPRVFPLARYVEVFLGKKYLGRFLVDDTGGNILGQTLDIWTPDCKDARKFGRQWGLAMLVPSSKGGRKLPIRKLVSNE